MKKILGISLVAMMAVTTARAEIASKAYVDTNFQAKALAQTVTNGNETTYPSEDAVYDFVTSQVSTGTSKGVKYGDSSTVGSSTQPVYINDGVATAISSLPATSVTEDTTHRFVTDTEKSTWNAKQNDLVVSGEGANLVGAGGITLAESNGVITITAPAGYDDAALAGRVTANENAIGTLNGNASTSGSVANSIAAAIGDTTGWVAAYGTGVDTVSEAIAAVNTKAGNALTSSSALDGANITAGTVPETALDTTTQNKINGAVQDVSSGTSTSGNGTIIVDGSPVSVYGLNSAAYTASTAYLPAVATSSTGTDGTYVLTMKVVGDVQTLAWETIER